MYRKSKLYVGDLCIGKAMLRPTLAPSVPTGLQRRWHAVLSTSRYLSSPRLSQQRVIYFMSVVENHSTAERLF